MIQSLNQPPLRTRCLLFLRSFSFSPRGPWTSSHTLYCGGGASKLCLGGSSLHLLLKGRCEAFGGFNWVGRTSSSSMMESLRSSSGVVGTGRPRDMATWRLGRRGVGWFTPASSLRRHIIWKERRRRRGHYYDGGGCRSPPPSHLGSMACSRPTTSRDRLVVNEIDSPSIGLLQTKQTNCMSIPRSPSLAHRPRLASEAAIPGPDHPKRNQST